MVINKTLEQTRLCLAPVGRLDSITANEFRQELEASLPGIKELVLDLTNLTYMSSAGLRVILMAHKMMSLRGSMKVTGVSDIIMEVFEITGFTNVLIIE